MPLKISASEPKSRVKSSNSVPDIQFMIKQEPPQVI